MIEKIFCPNAGDLLEKLSPNGPLFGDDPPGYQWLFRGHGSNEYELRSVAEREERWPEILALTCRSDVPAGLWGSQVLVEAKLLELFWTQSDEQGLVVPGESIEALDLLHAKLWAISNASKLPGFPGTADWPERKFLPVMALARHHGVPTRLLDWTRSAVVAAYFAINDNPEASGLSEVWAFNVEAFHEFNDAHRHPQTIRIVTPPRATNPNLHAQNGTFTITSPGIRAFGNNVDRRTIDGIVSDEIAKTDWKPVRPMFYRFTFPKIYGVTLRIALAKEGITAARLFPGYDGVVRAMKEYAGMVALGRSILEKHDEPPTTQSVSATPSSAD